MIYRLSVLIVLGIVFHYTPTFGQDSLVSKDIESPNYLFLNAIGDVSLVSINYERSYFPNSEFRIAAKLGLGYNVNFLLNGPSEHYFTLPNHVLAIYGNLHNIELGVGSTWIIGSEKSSDYLIYPFAGYRLIFPTKDMGVISIRLYGSILSKWDSYSFVALPFGLSIGKVF